MSDRFAEARHPTSIAIIGQMPGQEFAIAGQFLVDLGPLCFQQPTIVASLPQLLLTSQAHDLVLIDTPPTVGRRLVGDPHRSDHRRAGRLL
ncbi:hypothetical protein A5670_12700 [Mycolicibacterium fortuitum]|nr:hypothetical protein A5670_12700 [Mycolicibacterium fortuitum]